MGKKYGDNPFDGLDKIIEKEVSHIVETVGGTVQDVLRGVSETLKQNTAEGMQRLNDRLQSTLGNVGRSPYKPSSNNPQSTQQSSQHPAASAGTPSWKKGMQALHQWAAQPQNAAPKETWEKTTAGAMSAFHRVLCELCGGVLSASGIGLAIAALVVALVERDIFSTVVILLASLCALSFVGAFALFNVVRARYRLQRYASMLQGRVFCPVEELAAAVGQKPKFVRKDLKRLMQKGLFRKAYLTPDEAKLFGSSQDYLEFEASRAKEPAVDLTDAQRDLQAEGTSFLRDLRGQKTHIDDPAVLQQLEQIEKKTQNIFAWVKKNPAAASTVRRFTGYYLPTVLKLLKTYNEVDSHAENSTVATQIQADIMGVLQTVNQAFSNLQDGMLSTTAMSTSAEISALETVLAQEGLTGGGMG